MHLIVYGPEGSGKGTQAQKVAHYLGIPVLTSGDLVREAASEGNGEVAQACRNALSEGTYVPDEFMYRLWEDKLSSDEANKGFILDGFPRTLPQAQFLMGEVLKAGYPIDKVIYIEIDNESVIKRLAKRHRKLFAGSTVNHDAPERVSKRLEAYRKAESELLPFFKSQGIVSRVNGNQSPDEVFADITTHLPRK